VNEEKMIQVRHYMGFGVIDGGKDPLSDKRKTYGPRRKHPQISLKATGSFRVSIVEDSSLFRQLFRETLHNRFPSVEIYEAIDGEGALLQVETSRPNLIFMDIRLPGENGLQLTQRIKARYPNITVVILTGYDLPEYREASSQYADYFFSKDSWTTQNMFTWVDSILPTWG
jgi:CheY-like chemotaxis protein